MTIIDHTARQILMSKPASIPEGHPETVTRPSWQTRPCPPWCSTVHQESDFVSDRSHYNVIGDPTDLSLYGHVYQGEYRPGELDVSITQHYREADPTVGLLLPQHKLGDPFVTGELDLDLTVGEARALRDRLSLALDMVDGPALDTGLGACVDGASRRSPEHVTRLSRPARSEVTIASNLLQWVEPDSGQELEVEVDIASNPDTYTPAQARELAEQLRRAADHIDRLADAAERANGGAK